jgi:hypothetical protein
MSRWLERRKERRKYRKEVLRELGTITLPCGEAMRGIRPKSEKVFAHDHRTWLKQRCNWTKGSRERQRTFFVVSNRWGGMTISHSKGQKWSERQEIATLI